MSVSIRIYTQFGKEHIYTFEGYSTLNNTLIVYSNLGIQDVSIRNLELLVESNEPCKIHITDRRTETGDIGSNTQPYTTTECFIEGARLEKREIKYDNEETRFTNHRE